MMPWRRSSFCEWRAFRDGVLAGEFDAEKLSGPESPGRGGDEGRTAGSVGADRSSGVAAGTVSGGRSRGSAVPVAAELGPLDDELDILNSPAGRDLSGNPREGFPDAVATTDRPGSEPPVETIPGKRGRGSDADVQPEGVRTAESPGWRPDAATGAGGAGAASSRPVPVAADLNSPAGRPVDASTGEVVLSPADRPGSDAAGTGVPPDLVPAAQPLPFDELRSSGLLWLINSVVFHPRGFALALTMRGGEAIGWRLLGDGTEPWRFEGDYDANFLAAEATLDASRNRAIDEANEWAKAIAPLVPTDGAS